MTTTVIYHCQIRISVEPKNPSGRLMRWSCRVLKKRSSSINGH